MGALLPSLGGGPDGHVAGALYICMSSREWPVVCRVLAEAGAHWSDTIIWAKDRFTLGRGRLSAAVRAGLVRLVWRQPAALGRRPRSGRRLAHPASRRLAAAPHPEAAGTGRAGDRELQHPRRHGPGPLLRRGHDADRLRAHRAPRDRIEIDPRYVAATIARWEAFTDAAAVPLEPGEATDA